MRRQRKVLAELCGLLLLACTCVDKGAAVPQETKPSEAQRYTAPERFKIAGIVVNSVTGAPLERVKVSVADTRNRMRMIGTVTGEDGHFEFVDLPRGKFSLQGSKRGYITSSYEQHEQYSTAIVTGLDYTTDRLVLRLMPMAMIQGHVLDEAGEPVRSARVTLYMENHREGMSRVTTAGSASTDDRGYFDIELLEPGTYFASVNAKPWYAVHPRSGQDGVNNVPQALDVAYPTTFYGGGTEAESAVPIELKGGEHCQIDIHLSPVPALHLVFHVPTDPEGQANGFRMPILQKHVFDSQEYVQPGQMQPVSPGVFEMTGIPAGRYSVSMKSSNPEEAEQFSEMNLTRDGQDLSATRGEALGKLTVTVRMPDDEPLPKQYVVGLLDARQKPAGFQQGDPNGQVSFGALKSGKYKMAIGAMGKWYAVMRTISETGEASPGNGVTLAPGATVEVTAELAEGTVRIEGVAEKNAKPVSGVMVALVPSDPEAHVELFRRDQSDFDGTFLLQGVIPGTYTIVAVEDAWGFDWMKAGVLARYIQHGQQVIISEKMHSTLHLPDPVEVQPR